MNAPMTRRSATVTLLAGAGAAVLGVPTASAAQSPSIHKPLGSPPHPAAPTVVLIHGAFADASSWSAVVNLLQREGHPVLAPALPLRGLAEDAAYISSFLESVPGPVVLVGHSYGGAVISHAASGNPRVKALVYIAAFVPEVGESALDLTSKFPGSTLAQATTTQFYPLPGGGRGEELLIKQALFRKQFAAGVPVDIAQVMAVGQRPVAVKALQEKATAAAWKAIPSWCLVATQDRNIPPAAEQWMADRARAHTVRVVAPHAAAVSAPGAVAKLILRAVHAIR